MRPYFFVFWNTPFRRTLHVYLLSMSKIQIHTVVSSKLTIADACLLSCYLLNLHLILNNTGKKRLFTLISTCITVMSSILFDETQYDTATVTWCMTLHDLRVTRHRPEWYWWKFIPTPCMSNTDIWISKLFYTGIRSICFVLMSS